MTASENNRAPGRWDADASIIVALGGNLGWGGYGTGELLEAALAALPGAGLKVMQRSRLWRSAAWPDPTQPPFLNAVAVVETALTPDAAMAALHGVEAVFGRRRSQPNAARTLDLDLIAYGREVREAGPTLPHPRAAERLFVMGPLAELLPDWRHPVSVARAADLAARATVGRDAAPAV